MGKNPQKQRILRESFIRYGVFRVPTGKNQKKIALLCASLVNGAFFFLLLKNQAWPIKFETVGKINLKGLLL